MKRIDNKNYDLLWKWGVSYLFMSIYLESGYTKVDAISYHEADDNYLFIAKAARRTLSEKSLILYTKNFDTFVKNLKKNQQKIKKYLKEEKTISAIKLSNHQLLARFISMTNHLREAWSVYFPAEVHCYDLVAQKLTDNKYQHQTILKKHVKTISPWRQKQRDIINQIMYSPGPLDKYTKEISRRFKTESTYLHYKEIILLLRGKNINRIKNKYIIAGKFNSWKITSGIKAKQLFSQLLPFDSRADELKGMIGNSGYYKGKVRKIEFSLNTDFQKEIGNMKKGEILVSGSTGPEMILACKKAGAIVTEEGGILSHAAIVSRELNIPCIIGTKVATKIFKTGDLVEVDANEGIVKKLS